MMGDAKMGGKTLTWVLIGGGLVVWIAGQIFVPMTWDDFTSHLALTGLSAVAIGLGLSRTSLGREHPD